LLLLRRAARARGSACKRRQGRFPLTPLSARAILSRRIPAANASFTITPLFPASAVFAEHPPFRPTAFTSGPRQAVIAQTATRTARVSGMSPSSNVWKSCFACLPTLGKPRRIPSEPWTALDRDRPSIGRPLKFKRFTPRDSARRTRRDSPTRPQTVRLPSESREACRIASRRYRKDEEKTPATFRVPFLCAVRSRPPVLHAVQPCCYALTPAALTFACASARPLRSVGCRRRRRRRHPRSPQSPLRMHWRSPRRGTLRQTRLVFALHPSPPKTASPGSGQGCPAFRPVGRFSPVAAEPSLRKCRPPEPPSKSVLLCVAIPAAGLSPQSALRQHPL
jgi:hypothetical protein